MMRAPLPSLLLVALLPALSAQQPAPAGETAATLSAAESFAQFVAREVGEFWRSGSDDWRRLGDLVPQLPQYRYRLARVEFDAEGRHTGIDVEAWHDPARTLAAGTALLYVVPVTDGERCHAFCVRGDGQVAFTANEAGTAIEGEHPLTPDAALGDGGQGRLRDFPRTPQRGADGNLWQPLAMLPQRELRLMVVDEAGEPMARCELWCLPMDESLAVDALLVGGRVATTFEGDGLLRGAPARGLGFELREGRTRVPIDPAQVKVDGRSVRITVPKQALASARMNANESAAIATLKNISSAQAQCQASGVIDANQNGQGEYGTFAELAGTAPVRGGDGRQTISPPVLSRAFANVEGGVVVRSGYCFRMFLPGAGAAPVAEQPNGGAAGLAIDAGLAEVRWCAYAWPVVAGESGRRVFFINQAGDVLSSPNANGECSGATKAPAPEAAFDADGTGKLDAKPAANKMGKDGQRWVVIS